MQVDKIKSTKKGLVAEAYNYRLTNSNILYSLLCEIELTGKLAAPRTGNSMNGTFKAGELEYIYKISPVEMEGRGIVYNISFMEKESNDDPNMPTKRARENYLKILDTMYQIIKTFIKDKNPLYLGISSKDKSGYYNLYDRLWKSSSYQPYEHGKKT